MTITTSRALASMLSLTTIACGDPCLPDIKADTLIIQAAEMCDDTDTASTGPAVTTGGGTGGGVCVADPGAELLCIEKPGVGKMWGPCSNGFECDGDAMCIHGFAGNVCAPSCNGCDCPDAGCIGGTCNADNACAPACTAEGDPCPSPAMLCDVGVGACVWPTWCMSGEC